MNYSDALALMEPCRVPEGTAGRHSVQRFTISKDGAAMFNLGLMINGIGHRRVVTGEFTRLVREGTHFPIMSDTLAELTDHIPPVQNATGHCLIAGLGLGMVAEACLRKPQVTSVTVVEIEPDVIELTGPYLLEKYENLAIIEADIFEWLPEKGERFGMVWFDIWDDMNADNLPQMAKLSRRFTRFADWYGHWGRDEIRRDQRRWR